MTSRPRERAPLVGGLRGEGGTPAGAPLVTPWLSVVGALLADAPGRVRAAFTTLDATGRCSPLPPLRVPLAGEGHCPHLPRSATTAATEGPRTEQHPRPRFPQSTRGCTPAPPHQGDNDPHTLRRETAHLQTKGSPHATGSETHTSHTQTDLPTYLKKQNTLQDHST